MAQRSTTFSNTSTAWIQVWLHLIPGLAESKRVSVLSVPWIFSIQNSSEDNATDRITINLILFSFGHGFLLFYFSSHSIWFWKCNRISHLSMFKMVLLCMFSGRVGNRRFRDKDRNWMVQVNLGTVHLLSKYLLSIYNVCPQNSEAILWLKHDHGLQEAYLKAKRLHCLSNKSIEAPRALTMRL